MPVEISPLEGAPTEAASFRSFGTQIFTGDLDAAGESLAELFHIDAHRGRRCAEAFADQLADVGPVRFVRLNIFPDGGVSRLRLMGVVAR